MIFISVHVPKTAGTSLAHVFDHGTDRAVLYDYRSDYSNFLFSETERESFVMARPYVLSKFRFIHGHFSLQKYLDVMPMAKRLTCFRHPVKRIVSQFRHIWFEKDGSSADFRNMMAGMDIIGFAERDGIANAHRLHLGDTPPGELDFIFMNDALEEGLQLFRQKYPGLLQNEWARFPSLNTGADREAKTSAAEPLITDAQLDKLTKLIKDELEYFRQAKDAYAAQKRALVRAAS